VQPLRTENVITVLQVERPCPRYGQPWECIGHDVTDVVDLNPAEVVLRPDKRRSCQRRSRAQCTNGRRREWLPMSQR